MSCKILPALVTIICLGLSCVIPKPVVSPATTVNAVQDTMVVDTVGKKSQHVQVNTHGVALDTDQDGIPDYRDKELLTEQKCFPVDEDGIGNCPDPACCNDVLDHSLLDSTFPAPCQFNFNEIYFPNGSKTLGNKNKQILTMLSQEIKSNPLCLVEVLAVQGSTKALNKISQDRIKAVIQFMVIDEKISEDRFKVRYRNKLKRNAVVLKGQFTGVNYL